jgi:hypothetical protein
MITKVMASKVDGMEDSYEVDLISGDRVMYHLQLTAVEMRVVGDALVQFANAYEAYK